MKRVAVVGNCQAGPLASVLRLVLPYAQVTSHSVNSIRSEEAAYQIWGAIEASDVLVAQPLAARFGILCRDRLEIAHPKVSFVPNIYYSGHHPDLTYVGSPGNRVQGPMGDYHSIVVIDGHLRGMTAQEIDRSYEEMLLDLVDPASLESASSTTFLQRGSEIGFPAAPILDLIKTSACSMFTVNHPGTEVLVEVAKVVLERMQKSVSEPDWSWVTSVAFNSLTKDAAWPPLRLGSPQLDGHQKFNRVFRSQDGESLTQLGFIEASLSAYATVTRESLTPRRADVLLASDGLRPAKELARVTPESLDIPSAPIALELSEADGAILRVPRRDLQGTSWLSVEVKDRRVWSTEARLFPSGRIRLPGPLVDQLMRLDCSEVVRLIDSEGRNWMIQRPEAVSYEKSIKAEDVVPVGKLSDRRQVFGDLEPGTRRHIVEAMQATIADIQEVTGCPAFPVYGTLLGAVREQRLLPHDNDVDLGFLVEGDVVDVYRHMKSLTTGMAHKGYQIVPHSPGIAKVSRSWPGLGNLGVDVFPFHLQGEAGRMWLEVDAVFPDNPVVPLRPGLLEGVAVELPARYEEILLSIYGSDWRIPNPGFSYQGRRSRDSGRYFSAFYPDRIHKTSQRMWNAWFRGIAAAEISEEDPTNSIASRGKAVILVGVCPARVTALTRAGVCVGGLDLSPERVRATQETVSNEDFSVHLIRQGAADDFETLMRLVRDVRRERPGASLEVRIGGVADFLSRRECDDLAWILSLALCGSDLVRIESTRRADQETPIGSGPRRRHLNGVANVVHALARFGFEPKLSSSRMAAIRWFQPPCNGKGDGN